MRAANMIKRKSTEVRPRNQNQSLVANLSDAARPVPPLRLLGSAADKDKSAAAPIAASAAKPKEAARAAAEAKVKAAAEARMAAEAKLAEAESGSSS